jgi:hypothetical protein
MWKLALMWPSPVVMHDCAFQRPYSSALIIEVSNINILPLNFDSDSPFIQFLNPVNFGELRLWGLRVSFFLGLLRFIVLILGANASIILISSKLTLFQYLCGYDAAQNLKIVCFDCCSFFFSIYR